MTAKVTVARKPLRVGPASTIVRPYAVITVLVLAAVLFVLVCADLGRGEYPLSIGQVIDILGGGGTRVERVIVMDLRLPRAVIGVLAGAALGVAGALTQSTLRNPLAGPDLLGITAGAALAAIGVIVIGGASTGGALHRFGVPAAALAGGLTTAVVIYVLAWSRGFDGFRLVLIGIGINAMMTAGIGWLLVFGKLDDVIRAQIWLNGSINSTDWSQVGPLAVGFAVAGAFALISVPTMATLRLGDDKARSLGVRLQSRQTALLLAAVVLASLATAVTGPIGFVALAAPQIARRLQRCPVEPIVASALVGAILVIVSDIVARTILPVDLPVGIVTSALGGVFLLYLLVVSNRKVTV